MSCSAQLEVHPRSMSLTSIALTTPIYRPTLDCMSPPTVPDENGLSELVSARASDIEVKTTLMLCWTQLLREAEDERVHSKQSRAPSAPGAEWDRPQADE